MQKFIPHRLSCLNASEFDIFKTCFSVGQYHSVIKVSERFYRGSKEICLLVLHYKAYGVHILHVSCFGQ